MASHKRWHKPKPSVKTTSETSAIQKSTKTIESRSFSFHENNSASKSDSSDWSPSSPRSFQTSNPVDSWTKFFYQHYSEALPTSLPTQSLLLSNTLHPKFLNTAESSNDMNSSNWFTQLYSNYLTAANGLLANFSVGLPFSSHGISPQYDLSSQNFNSQI